MPSIGLSKSCINEATFESSWQWQTIQKSWFICVVLQRASCTAICIAITNKSKQLWKNLSYNRMFYILEVKNKNKIKVKNSKFTWIRPLTSTTSKGCSENFKISPTSAIRIGIGSDLGQFNLEFQKEFTKNSQRILKEFPKNFQKILQEEFQKNSQRISNGAKSSRGKEKGKESNHVPMYSRPMQLIA